VSEVWLYAVQTVRQTDRGRGLYRLRYELFRMYMRAGERERLAFNGSDVSQNTLGLARGSRKLIFAVTGRSGVFYAHSDLGLIGIYCVIGIQAEAKRNSAISAL